MRSETHRNFPGVSQSGGNSLQDQTTIKPQGETASVTDDMPKGSLQNEAVKNTRTQTAIGICAIIFAVFTYFIAIPFGVSTPSNVPNIVLSPLFWPNIIAALTGLVGLGLILTAKTKIMSIAGDEPPFDFSASGGWQRLGIFALLLIIYMASISRLGIVWSSMLAFISLALLIKTNQKITALIVAVVMPLALYAFFAHVAGIALPQGLFVRLP